MPAAQRNYKEGRGHLLNCSFWALTVLRAKSLALRLSLMGVSSRRCSSDMLCSTFSSMGRPWQSHPGTYLVHDALMLN